MSEIAFSCMINPHALALPSFEARQHVQVHVQHMDWDGAWDRLLRVALDGQGPDVSEIGSTWLGSLVDMNALRPVEGASQTLGDLEHFFPAARWAITRPGDRRVWAVPFLTDTRVVYYRRDWLKEAGVDEAAAFQSPASLAATLDRLQSCGFAVPWAMPTRGRDVVYTAASFIWAAGGRFRTQDGRQFRLGEPEALAGLCTFFDLHRFLAPPAQGLDVVGMDALFRQGQAAAVLSGPWLLATLSQDAWSEADVGIAPVPGVPFIGGTHLVIWQHARYELKIAKLMQYLTGPEVQRRCLREMGNLPARVDVLNDEPYAGDPRYQAFAHSLKSGRVLTVSYRWAAVEKRLVDMLSRLWSDLVANPELDLEAEIAVRVNTLIAELQRTVLATW
ncbi:MAG: extracellular solute-binding protein [Anaerolineae bacterium]|nr:extracellular solute-binding protein [Anaerolineae bacterium]